MSARKKIGFSFYVELPKEISGTPTKRTIVNNFDYIGDVVSVERINGESNVDFKKRIWDKTVHPGGASYEGVVNEVGRKLGLLRKHTITIDLKLNSAGEPVATSPRVDILANRVILYSDWRPNGTAIIDKEIRTYQQNDDGFYLNDLVNKINESEYFSASLVSGIRPNDFSSCLVRGSSINRIPLDYIKPDKFQYLDYNNISRNSLSFEETKIFETEVTGEPSQTGEYKVDYINGTITSYTTPSGNYGCSYHFNVFPMEIDSVPIQVFSLQDDNFTTELFEKELAPSGKEINSLPNEEGSEIYHQLFMETKVFWGK